MNYISTLLNILPYIILPIYTILLAYDFLRARYEKRHNGETRCGWYHSHYTYIGDPTFAIKFWIDAWVIVTCICGWHKYMYYGVIFEISCYGIIYLFIILEIICAYIADFFKSIVEAFKNTLD